MSANKPPFDGEWVEFLDAFEEVSRRARKIKQKDYLPSGLYPIVDQGQSDVAGYANEQTGLYVDVPAIVFGDHTRCVKYMDVPFFIGADGVKILKPKLSDDVRYWWHALRAIPIEGLGYSRHYKLLKEACVRSYSLDMQISIRWKLDSVLLEIDRAEQCLAMLDTLVKSRFVEMFGDPTVEHDGWPYETIGNVCQVITGNTPSRKDEANYGDSIEWCKTDNITDARYLTRAAESLSEAGAQRGRIAPAGSVLMACIAGSIKTIGKVAINDRPVAFNQQINALIPMDGLSVDYLLWALRLSKDYLCSDVNMQLKGILNKSALSAKRFAIPPLALQQEFAAFVAEVDKSRFNLLKAYGSIIALFRVLFP